MKPDIKPIESRKKYESVGDRIIQLILDQTFPEGSKLMSEAELANALMVGRSSVREAIKSLQMNGIVLSTAGKGTFISEHAITSINLMRMSAMLTDDKRTADLIETRLILEQQIAGIAALRSNEKDICEMERWMDRMNNSKDKEDILACSHMFHRAMCMATHNEVLVELHKFVSRNRLKSPHVVDQTVEKVRTDAANDHQAILDAIKAHDSSAAEELARQHLVKNYGAYLKQVNTAK